MSHETAAAKVGKLRAVTVESGATPAEAALAALLARRLSFRIAPRSRAAIILDDSALAPGVQVHVV